MVPSFFVIRNSPCFGRGFAYQNLIKLNQTIIFLNDAHLKSLLLIIYCISGSGSTEYEWCWDGVQLSCRVREEHSAGTGPMPWRAGGCSDCPSAPAVCTALHGLHARQVRARPTRTSGESTANTHVRWEHGLHARQVRARPTRTSGESTANTHVRWEHGLHTR